MASDSELIDRLREFLRNSDLNTTTTGIVRRKLEEDFGINLSDRKVFIREQVDLFLQIEHEKADDKKGEAAGVEDEIGGDEDQIKKEEEDEEDEDGEVDTTSNGKGKKGELKKRGGFNKLCGLSPQLQEFTGAPKMARTEVVKKLWAYIREKELQNPNDKRNILCDDTLHTLFGVKSINMFQMSKALTKHIWPLESDEGNYECAVLDTEIFSKRLKIYNVRLPSLSPVVPVKSTPKEKPKKQEREKDSDEPKENKRHKSGTSGFLAPLQLSDALIKFLGTGESALSRPDTVKRMWEYIKKNNVQDPSDKRRVICDEKLKELFGVDSFNGFTVSKLLSAHFVKTK